MTFYLKKPKVFTAGASEIWCCLLNLHVAYFCKNTVGLSPILTSVQFSVSFPHRVYQAIKNVSFLFCFLQSCSKQLVIVVLNSNIEPVRGQQRQPSTANIGKCPTYNYPRRTFPYISTLTLRQPYSLLTFTIVRLLFTTPAKQTAYGNRTRNGRELLARSLYTSVVDREEYFHSWLVHLPSIKTPQIDLSEYDYALESPRPMAKSFASHLNKK